MTVIERERVVTERERRARVLEAAALEIEVRGHATGDMENGGGGVCLAGGVGFCAGETGSRYLGWQFGATTRVWWGVGGCPLDLGNFNETIWRFNDQIAQSADEVTFLLRWRAEEIRDGR